MAGRIQGITVEIGGDTTRLTSALQGVNKEIKSTQSQLKDVEKLLKLDPSNTELLSQKQKLLTQHCAVKGYDPGANVTDADALEKRWIKKKAEKRPRTDENAESG